MSDSRAKKKSLPEKSIEMRSIRSLWHLYLLLCTPWHRPLINIDHSALVPHHHIELESLPRAICRLILYKQSTSVICFTIEPIKCLCSCDALFNRFHLNLITPGFKKRPWIVNDVSLNTSVRLCLPSTTTTKVVPNLINWIYSELS